MSKSFVGIDVSKNVLDVAFSDGRVLQVSNDEAGFAALRQELAGKVPGLVLMEATGGLERSIAAELSAAASHFGS